jgi:hypothetical protein
MYQKPQILSWLRPFPVPGLFHRVNPWDMRIRGKLRKEVTTCASVAWGEGALFVAGQGLLIARHALRIADADERHCGDRHTMGYHSR